MTIFADQLISATKGRESMRPETAGGAFLATPDDLHRQFMTCKEGVSAMQDFGKPKEKKYQTQIIRNVLRNLVRKKNSPSRKTKAKSKSKNPDEKVANTVKKNKPESLASSKSRKLHKLFTRKNLSLSIENRKLKDFQNRFQDIPFVNTLK